MKRFVALLLFLLLVLDGFLFFWLQRKKTSLPKETKAPFVCPVPGKYCLKGKIIEVEGRYLGIGFFLPEGTPIFAVIEGATRGGRVSYTPKIGNGRYPTIIIEGEKFEAVYTLTGEDYQGWARVSQGEEIARARKGVIGNTGANLMIRIMEKKTDKILELKPGDLAKK